MEKKITPPIIMMILWIFVKLNVISADLLGFLERDFLNGIINTGYAGEIQLTSTFLLIAAILLEINIAMVVVSRLAPHRINRTLNLIAPPIVIAFIIGGGSTSLHYLFFATIECIALITIMFIAWKWHETP